MSEELIIRIRLVDRPALAKAVVRHLVVLKEDPPEGAMIDHIEVWVTTQGGTGWFAGHKQRLLALRRGLEEVERVTRRSDASAGTAGSPATAASNLPPIDVAALRIRLRGLTRTQVGLPQLDLAVLEDRGDRTYAWIESGAILAIGPEAAAIAEACQPYTVGTAEWQQIWRDHTSVRGNPWRPPSSEELATWFSAALDATFGAADHGYRSPLAAVRTAFDEWAHAEARHLIGLLSAAVAGESRHPDGASALAADLAALARRAAVLPGAGLVPLALGQLAAGPLVEVWPTPRGLWFDALGASADGYVRVRAIRLGGSETPWHVIGHDGLARGAMLVEGGDVVLMLSNP